MSALLIFNTVMGGERVRSPPLPQIMQPLRFAGPGRSLEQCAHAAVQAFDLRVRRRGAQHLNPSTPWLSPERFVCVRPAALLMFTNARGSAKRQSRPKIGATHWCSFPRKSLVKGERLVRYEEKPE